MREGEGVIKFDLRFTPSAPLPFDRLRELNAWRKVLYRLGLIGEDPSRYGGAGFGNVSERIEPFDTGSRPFVVSGTQTGGLPDLTERHYAIVIDCDPARNLVVAQGPIMPSSESLTHGMLYCLDATVRFVFHVHSPEIWRKARALGIPVTRAAVAYGTPEMAEEVRRLFAQTSVGRQRIFAMDGHEDGIVSFGQTADEAGTVMLRTLVRALQR